MTEQQLRELIGQGESIKLEFKECRTKVNKDLYESVCAFLNRFGGTILLGVKDNGKITGIDKEALPQIRKDLVTTLNNHQKITPPCYVIPEEHEIDGEIVISLLIPGLFTRISGFTLAQLRGGYLVSL